MRAPVLALCAAASVLAPAFARAEVVVTACADVGAGVEVGAATSLDVVLDRDPAQASAARLDFLAFDPDNLNGVVEVDVTLQPSGVAVAPFTDLTLGNAGSAFDSRSVSYSVAISPGALVQGTNTVLFEDNDDVSVFTVERLCLTLLGAPPPLSPPPREVFCADDVFAADPTVDGATFASGSSKAPGVAATIDIDVPVSGEARFGLDLVAYVDSTDAGDHFAGFNNGLLSLTQTFTADNAANDDQYRIVRAPEDLGSSFAAGGSAQSPTTNAFGVSGDFAGHLWMACLVIEDEFPPPGIDAGAPEEDAGPVVEDAGEPDDDGGGVPVELDAGLPPPADAGTPPDDDAGKRPPLDDDAGPIAPPSDAGTAPPRDAGDPGPDPSAVDDEQQARAELTDPSFRVTSTCASTTAGDALPLALGGLLMLALRRRARRRT